MKVTHEIITVHATAHYVKSTCGAYSTTTGMYESPERAMLVAVTNELHIQRIAERKTNLSARVLQNRQNWE